MAETGGGQTHEEAGGYRWQWRDGVIAVLALGLAGTLWWAMGGGTGPSEEDPTEGEAIGVFGIFGIAALVYTGWVSFHEWNPIAVENPFVGLDNYTRLMGDPRFWNAVWNTFTIWLLSTIPQLALALFLAHVLNEALLRWNDPVAGMVSPADFIPVAEDTGLILWIGEWVLYDAAQQVAHWARQGLDIKV